ncbi:cryptochrome/photolyase family protein [Parahaliea mediterranea]|uniref:cryptochrome/photolyase family protein n=1 Tax=Parahaliea mediterranea TaxID=651086 RepID=UPI000E2E9F38|nr:deoxyribodipyrimidine photo-lyase [Parahaliea mediterranea]
MSQPIIYWFRQDLRLADLPGLQAAAASTRPVIPLYILDEDAPGSWQPGGASRWWLHHSLQSLAAELAKRYGQQLLLRRGKASDILPELCRQANAESVLCTRQYEPWAAAQEQQLHTLLAKYNVTLRRYPGSLLFEPGSVMTRQGGPYKVFTPFWKACCSEPEPRFPLPAPEQLPPCDAPPQGESLASMQLAPSHPDWAEGWQAHWQPGTAGAGEALGRFLQARIEHYSHGRDVPALQATSRLSPHLHFGELSPRAIWHACHQVARERPALANEVHKFLSELGWREFSYHLLHHFPDLPAQPFRADFTHFPWQRDATLLAAWQQGQTGYPLVDAGMRELWQTGYMHNRVRMVAASFLTKHLLQPWQDGQAWFWDTLVDADLANNAASWQWVAGCGADAAPYFRIFNPAAQGNKFDPDGDYVKRWVPELRELPPRYLHQPSQAPAEVLAAAGITLGENYPRPLVEHSWARERALASYRSLAQ